MRTRAEKLDGLLGLASYEDQGSRRVVFRQSIASLALMASLDAPGPLDGLNPEALLRSVRIALSDGLLDDLSWIAPSAAAVALYELGAALPLGAERRDLGRRLLTQAYDGSASTFVALSTRMAAGSARGLTGAGMRSRIALSLLLPAAVDLPIDALALALASRREQARDWIGAASSGSLPERCLAGRLLERAAREAARRGRQGDEHPLRLFRTLSALPVVSSLPQPGRRRPTAASDTIARAWSSLLNDREPLVWRHVAGARGLLAGVLPEIQEEIHTQLDPDLSPTEWRRGACSLVASIAVDPDHALPQALGLLRGPLLQSDPGIATSMVWGVVLAADAEPEAAEELLNALALASPISVADGVIELRRDVGSLGARAAELCAQALGQSLNAPQKDDGLKALARAILRDLENPERSELAAAIHSAVDAFVEIGTREAHARALRALDVASRMLSAFEALEVTSAETDEGSAGRHRAMIMLRELDAHLLESGLLRNLLLLDRRPSSESASVRLLDDFDERFTRRVVQVQSQPQSMGPPVHLTLHHRELRVLLHLLDAETTDFGDDHERRARARERWTSACQTLLRRLLADPASPLGRAIAASIARAFDTLVRDTAADAADVLLYAGMRLPDTRQIDILSEASVNPDVIQLLEAYARFVRTVAAHGESGPPSRHRVVDPLAALDALVTDLPAGASQRTEVLRGALSRMARGLHAIASAQGLRILAETGAGDISPLAALEDALAMLAQLTAGARRRFGDSAAEDESPIWWSLGAHGLTHAVGVAVRDNGPGPDMRAAIASILATARAAVPLAIAEIVAQIVPRLETLPAHARASQPDTMPPAELAFPAWLPHRRTLGGFYVHRQLGGGAVGTVFVVTRAEERHDPRAERFALKVPDYDATAARSVSEAEFLKLFRDEAGALLSIPDHPNLPRFVTFDAGARPKPILVMELIEGVRCDQMIDARRLSMTSAIATLDGVLAGLEAMHSVGVGHLDIKPTNVVLRGGKQPVLVDFGLAGRHLRPGCATGCYGSPEVWGVIPHGAAASPMTADVYSFGCLAYEVITGETLFDAATSVALVTAHVTHDGLPPAIRLLWERPDTAVLATYLYNCLRHNPSDRLSVKALRAELKRITPELSRLKWPVVIELPPEVAIIEMQGPA
jgi:hypothetical protein